MSVVSYCATIAKVTSSAMLQRHYTQHLEGNEMKEAGPIPGQISSTSFSSV